MNEEASPRATRPVLFGVSVGPGDPALMTIAAIRAIERSDVVCYPKTASGQRAADVAWAFLEGKERLELALPMGATEREREAAYRAAADRIACHLGAGRSVAYLCLGDISLYSTFTTLTDHLDGSRFTLEVIPGVTSVSAAAARLQVPLATAGERLLVLEANDALADPCVLATPATKAILKVGSHLGALKERLCMLGTGTRTHLAERVGLDGERLYPDIADAEHASYLSLAIVRTARDGAQKTPRASDDLLPASDGCGKDQATADQC